MAPSSPSGPAVLCTSFTLLTAALAIIGTRIYLRLRIQKQSLVAGDYLMISGWISAVAYISFQVVYELHGALNPEVNWDFGNLDADAKEIEHLSKMSWASNIPFYSAFYLCKASLLATYLRLFPYFMETRRMLVWAAVCYCVIAYLITLGLHLLSCLPLERHWIITGPIKACDPDWGALVLHISWGLHFFGSFILFTLPFLVIHELSLTKRVRMGVYAMFLLGLVDMTISLARFLSVQLGNFGAFRSVTIIELWNALDVCVGLLIVCLTSLRPFLGGDLRASEIFNYDESTKSGLPHREDRGGFEEIDDFEIPGANGFSSGRISRNSFESAKSELDVSWAEDEKRTQDAIEMMNVKARNTTQRQTEDYWTNM